MIEAMLDKIYHIASSLGILWFFQSMKAVLFIGRRFFSPITNVFVPRPDSSRGTLKKLQLGCGSNKRPGWLNTDFTLNPRVFFLDASRSFPFADSSFDYVYSEHMIEHISASQREVMLKEVFRVLKPGGIFRVATPDIRFLIDLYLDPDKDIHARYIDWSCRTFIKNHHSNQPSFVLNNFFRAWGHTFIYDEATLRMVLEESGFRNIERVALGKSRHADLAGLEYAERLPEGFLKAESLILEAEKPGR